MPKYHIKKGKLHRINWLRILFAVLAAAVLAAIAVLLVVVHGYENNLKPLDKDQTEYHVIIPSGYTPQETADKLKLEGLIRSSSAFEWYVRLHGLDSKLQAGTYSVKSSYSIPVIAKMMANGKIERNLVIILPDQRDDQIRDELKNDKFDPAAVDKAFDSSLYSDIPVLADKPAGASLEGYLFPDTFQRDISTDPSEIVRESIMEMNAQITPDIKNAFAGEGLSVYQGLTLASVVENEVSKPADRTQVAQVFLSRLKQNMPFQSDATVTFANAVGDDNYNTYHHTGLPPGPISSITADSIQAVAHPANTGWLYFVTGDDGTTYFSTNIQQHEQQTQQYCHKLCGR